MLLREAVLETFLELFTASGETRESAGLTVPCWTRWTRPGAWPERPSALFPLQEVGACQARPEWAGASVGGALQGVRPTGGNICEPTTIFRGFLKKVNLMWAKGISWKTAPRGEDKNCSFLARVSRALAEHREVARHAIEPRSPGAQEPVGPTGGGKRNAGGSL